MSSLYCVRSIYCICGGNKICDYELYGICICCSESKNSCVCVICDCKECDHEDYYCRCNCNCIKCKICDKCDNQCEHIPTLEDQYE
jgi:hypothetical protein